MAEKININNRETDFQGLWYHKDEHRYTSSVLDAASLKNLNGNFKIVMYKNRFHEDGDNKPNYNIKFRGVDADNIYVNKLEFINEICNIDDETALIEAIKEHTGKRLYTEDEVYRIIHGMQIEYGLNYGDDIISDFIDP